MCFVRPKNKKKLNLSQIQGKRYYKRFIKILSIYTDLELCASLRGAEYDKAIAERIVLIYQTYLDVSITHEIPSIYGVRWQ